MIFSTSSYQFKERKMMTRQQEYIRKNVQRINFTYRKKYDYRLYNFFERLNKQYKGNHIEPQALKYLLPLISPLPEFKVFNK